MADAPGEASGQSQVYWCSSYPHSFPSQPPDIKNWFSSYEYDSPEVPELDADPGGGNGSETQDPLEYPVPRHSLLKHAPQDGCNASRENCSEGQSDHQVSTSRDWVRIGRGTVEQGAKRKRSLRELFGAGFLEVRDEAAETESPVAMQRDAVKPLSNCSAVGIPHTKRSHEGAVEHSNLLMDCDGISSAETQECSSGGQQTEGNRHPVHCDGTVLTGTEKSLLEYGIVHIELPFNCHVEILADTEKSFPKDVAEYRMLPANSNGISSASTEESSPGEEIGRRKLTVEYKGTEELAAADGFIVIKVKGKPAEECKMNNIPKSPVRREKAAFQENHNILEKKVLVQEQARSPLAHTTNFAEVAGAPRPEVSGKWKCPRKGKPYVGPPLKQLRLEQWVRRVN